MTEITKDKYRVFVLGAGFSKPAGLPLCFELFEQILEEARIKYKHIGKTKLDRDIENFLDYQLKVKGKKLSKKEINFEDFISYLDIEHFLQLRGSDHWSDEGNVSQIIIKNLIAYVLYKKEYLMEDKDFVLYEKFAEKLKPDDVIITFNYDTILEKTFLRKDIPYRLYPTRFESLNFGGGTVKNTDEIVLLKMHGSIDWFDFAAYERKREARKDSPIPIPDRHSVFAREGSPLLLKNITDEPYPKHSPLNKIYRIDDVSNFLSTSDFSSASPLLISPSHSKMIYLNPLVEFWNGYNNAGVGNGSVVIIGFSLPEHDEYIRQPLYHLVDNFQNNDYFEGFLEKTNLKMIDYKQSQSEIDSYKKNYSFVDWDRADCYFDGFDEKSLEVIFEKL